MSAYFGPKWAELGLGTHLDRFSASNCVYNIKNQPLARPVSKLGHTSSRDVMECDVIPGPWVGPVGAVSRLEPLRVSREPGWNPCARLGAILVGYRLEITPTWIPVGPSRLAASCYLLAR